MPSQSQVLQMILSARLKAANLAADNLTNMTAGFKSKGFDFIKKLYLYTQAINRQYQLKDYSSPNFITVYDCLCKMVGVDATVNTINPNYQGPNITINTGSTISGNNIVWGQIQFNNVTTVQLLNYNTTYKQIYGNNLVALEIYLTGYTEDVQTPVNIIYAVSNDPTTDIVSITWGPYPVPVSGYITIAGVMPVTGTPSGGGGGSVPFTFTEANLLQDSNQSWYLPLVLPIGKSPVFTNVNGISLITTYDTTFSPARLYGFSSNNPQTIVVSVI